MRLKRGSAYAEEYCTGEGSIGDDAETEDWAATFVPCKLARTAARAETMDATGSEPQFGVADAHKLSSDRRQNIEVTETIKKSITNVDTLITIIRENGLLRVKPMLLSPDVRDVFEQLPVEVDLAVVVDDQPVAIEQGTSDAALKAASISASRGMDATDDSCLLWLLLSENAFSKYVGYCITRYTAESCSIQQAARPRLTLHLKSPAVQQHKGAGQQREQGASLLVDNCTGWTTHINQRARFRNMPSSDDYKPKINCPHELCREALPAVLTNEEAQLEVTLFKDGTEVTGISNKGIKMADVPSRYVVVQMDATTNRHFAGCRVEKLRAKPPNLLQVFLRSSLAGNRTAEALPAYMRSSLVPASAPAAAAVAADPSTWLPEAAAAAGYWLSTTPMVLTAMGGGDTLPAPASATNAASAALLTDAPMFLYNTFNMPPYPLSWPQPMHTAAQYSALYQQQQLQGIDLQQQLAGSSLPVASSCDMTDSNKQSAAVTPAETSREAASNAPCSSTAAAGSVKHTPEFAAAVDQLRQAARAAATRRSFAGCAEAPTKAAAAAGQILQLKPEQVVGRLVGKGTQADSDAGICDNTPSNKGTGDTADPEQGADGPDQGIATMTASATDLQLNPSAGMAAALAPAASAATAIPYHVHPRTQESPPAKTASVDATRAVAGPVKLPKQPVSCTVEACDGAAGRTQQRADQRPAAGLSQHSIERSIDPAADDSHVIVISDNEDHAAAAAAAAADELNNRQQNKQSALAVNIKHEQSVSPRPNLTRQQQLQTEQQARRSTCQALGAAVLRLKASASSQRRQRQVTDTLLQVDGAQQRAQALHPGQTAAAGAPPPPPGSAVLPTTASAQPGSTTAGSEAVQAIAGAAAVPAAGAGHQLLADARDAMACYKALVTRTVTGAADGRGMLMHSIKLETATAADRQLGNVLFQAQQTQTAVTAAAHQLELAATRTHAVSGTTAAVSPLKPLTAVRVKSEMVAAAAATGVSGVEHTVVNDQETLATPAPAFCTAAAVPAAEMTSSDVIFTSALPADFVLADCNSDILLAGQQLTDLLDHLHAPDHQVMQLNDYIISLSHQSGDDNRVVRFWYDYSQIRLWVRRRNDEMCGRIVQQILSSHSRLWGSC